MKPYYGQIIDKLQNAKGNNEKVAIFKEFLSGPDTEAVFSEYVRYLFDPYFVVRVRKIRTDIVGDPASKQLMFVELLAYLKNNKSRTDQAVKEIEQIIASAHPDEVPYLYMFINRDIRAGVGATLVNKAVKGFIDEFEVALASPFDAKRIKFPCYVEPKLDGCRLIAFVEGDTVTYVSRNGLSFDLPNFSDYLISLAGGRDWVFDGEVIGMDFPSLMKQVRRKDNRDLSKLEYAIFDGMSLSNWKAKSSPTYSVRKEMLEQMVPEEGSIKSIFGIYAHNWEQLNNHYKQCVDMGYEGIVIKQDVPYEWKRSKNWIKMKPEETFDLEIVGTFEGEGKYVGMLGGIQVVMDGVVTDVGSGFTDAMRKTFWLGRMGLIGQIAEIQAQEVIKDSGKLRFPVYLKLRPDKQ